MTLKLGDEFPNFTLHTNEGNLGDFHEWIHNSWAILFSHPADFTPVCTTELARAAQLSSEFRRRDVKMIAISCDSADTHNKWIPDILQYGQDALNWTNDNKLPFPIIADEKRQLANYLGMIDSDEIDSDGLPLTARAVFIIGPDKRLKLSILYPATTGRNFDEIIRVIDSLQLTQKRRVATPVDWKVNEHCMVLPGVRDDEISALFGNDTVTVVGVPSKKKYLRTVHLSNDDII